MAPGSPAVAGSLPASERESVRSASGSRVQLLVLLLLPGAGSLTVPASAAIAAVLASVPEPLPLVPRASGAMSQLTENVTALPPPAAA